MRVPKCQGSQGPRGLSLPLISSRVHSLAQTHAAPSHLVDRLESSAMLLWL